MTRSNITPRVYCKRQSTPRIDPVPSRCGPGVVHLVCLALCHQFIGRSTCIPAITKGISSPGTLSSVVLLPPDLQVPIRFTLVESDIE